ncbi:PREDICTED: uncharacterized protein LOC104808493 [Tarenaya hassleriana]|uniref:uncharacterized protein LOC104808493 n=1 Tax=Tarenaya hassleriana TaxID=28532 RepID=UPI00053C31B7|nr:PREDICTED: uncharacterized protein LOC104808493 [Tarenaya hassleriana]
MMDTLSRNSREQKHHHHEHEHDHDDDDDDHHQEESGWTTYLEGFSNHYNVNGDGDSCSDVLGSSPSLVSDAGTGRAFQHVAGGGSPAGFPARLKFRKLARTKEICGEDESLEDTASSPVNSPKVSEFEQVQTTPRKLHEYISSSFVMGNGRIPDQIHGDGERNIKNNLKDAKNDLRSKGLCLVPISMLANYNP